MTAEQVAFVAAQRRRILNGPVWIESEVEYPIATNPLNPHKPFVVTHDITFHVGGRVVTVKAGFCFDGASKPAIVEVLKLLVPLLLLHWVRPSKYREFFSRLFRPLNTFYRNLFAACLHDRDYWEQDIEQVTADACYQSLLVRCGENYWVARAERGALDWCGHWAWENNAKLKAAKTESVSERTDA